MATGPNYSDELSSQEDRDFFDLMEAEDPDALEEYTVRQAGYLVKKAAVAFAAGVQRIVLSTNEDWSGYGGSWFYKYQGLLRDVTGVRKAAFYSAQQLIRAIDGWYTAEQLGSEPTYKFTFRGKGPAAVAWKESGSGTVDLSSVWPSQSVRVKPVVTTLSVSDLPIYPAESTVASTVVPVGVVPVIVVAA